ncbi:KamA family radical SAM protein [Lentisphaerota bacterium ZTH]|nr:KamA family radical SAM protein [Lentisphaerota bacterium]WET06212.1 KamA family radical SAM protein [Lentisphaerota bacterium ZTH]
MSKSEFANSVSEAARFLGIAPPSDLEEVEKHYPVMISSYYLSLIRNQENLRQDPVWRQCMPDRQELEDQVSDFDPLAEEEQMAAPKLIHRYVDRVVLLATGKCATRCRFCFRKRTWANGTELKDITQDELEAVCAYLRKNPAVREVLVSGGDPLMLSARKLKNLLEKISGIPSIEVIRVGSRVPVTFPQLLTAEKAEILAAFPSLWLMTHFNHPNEVTPEAVKACMRVIHKGVPVLNQTVLMAGVNDNAAVLEKLFRKLIASRIKPHYLFHIDPVRGVRHFSTGIDKGLEILREFRPRLSSLAVPTFAIDLPEGGGKVALQPDYEVNGKYPSVTDKHLIGYEERPES